MRSSYVHVTHMDVKHTEAKRADSQALFVV
jgi:hypothetical protein